MSNSQELTTKDQKPIHPFLYLLLGIMIFGLITGLFYLFSTPQL